MKHRFCGITFTVLVLLPFVLGHGRLMDPPSRSSMWRLGYKTPPNYNDNALNCGGFSNEWYVLHGKCGVCGDVWQDPTPRNNEAGGLYGKGIITKTYTTGQDIQISVQITANHGGWFEFRLCANNNPTKVITQSCLDQHLLQLEGGGTRHHLIGTEGDVIVTAKLPPGLTCSQCVLQWKWNAGNSYGIDPDGKGCIGCGHQEEFYGCSDIAIGTATFPLRPTAAVPLTTKQPQPTPVVTRIPPTVIPPVVVTTRRQRPPQTSAPVYTNPPNPRPTRQIITGGCHGINLWQGDAVLDQWCSVNCAKGLCPPMYCTCSGSPSRPYLHQLSTRTSYPQAVFKATTPNPVVPQTRGTPPPVVHTAATRSYSPIQTTHVLQTQTPNVNQHPTGSIAKTSNCHGVHLWNGVAVLDVWCSTNCAQGLCPPLYCDCSGSAPAFNSPTTKYPMPVFRATTMKSIPSQPPRRSFSIGPVTSQTSRPPYKQPTPFLFVTKAITQSQTTLSGSTQPGPCRAINNLQGIPKYDKFCNDVCNGNSGSTCPPLLCECH
ncbi:uncharacterized protein LOC121389749 [Gigantopelta aegis]|uniref:uncharacterized protein LOC121389749 n=1 Tax=Gigantopelta aegis TaxID=1735272 RepID=UPI001B88D50B|nr:uncharacterized protein LOC121389749 [Gigantopelta aegis]